ncbi:unnamed protein product, partial [Discosporangium mesarthrocarpum]
FTFLLTIGTNRSNLLTHISLAQTGKTTILCHLVNLPRIYKDMDTFCTAPTVGLQLVEFRRQNVRFAAWDMSGQGRYRDLWASFAAHVHALIFVVDVTDVSRIAVARSELYSILGGEGE